MRILVLREPSFPVGIALRAFHSNYPFAELLLKRPPSLVSKPFNLNHCNLGLCFPSSPWGGEGEKNRMCPKPQPTRNPAKNHHPDLPITTVLSTHCLRCQPGRLLKLFSINVVFVHLLLFELLHLWLGVKKSLIFICDHDKKKTPY